jgi:hypothetical protein
MYINVKPGADENDVIVEAQSQVRLSINDRLINFYNVNNFYSCLKGNTEQKTIREPKACSSRY